MVDFVDINGAQLPYRNTSPSDAPLLITLHGGRGQGSHQSDFKVYGQLNDKLRVLSLDHRRHGKSSRTKPYTFDQTVDDVEAFRNQFVQDEKVIICGGSFGDFLALYYAIKYAPRVSHLILRGTAASHHHKQGAMEKKLRQKVHVVPSSSETMPREKIFKAGLKSDLGVSSYNSRLIAEKIPDSILTIVEGADQGGHIEKPEIVLHKIRELVSV